MYLIYLQIIFQHAILSQCSATDMNDTSNHAALDLVL